MENKNSNLWPIGGTQDKIEPEVQSSQGFYLKIYYNGNIQI